MTIIRTSLLLALAATTSVFAKTDWGRFRGPNGSGVAETTGLPNAIDDASTVWKVALGKGWSSPVLWKDMVLVTAETGEGKRAVIALSARDGKEIWRHEESFAKHKIHNFNSFASSSPFVDEQRIYVNWSTGTTIQALALDHTGKQLWKNEHVADYIHEHGTGISPVVEDGIMIVRSEFDWQRDGKIYTEDPEQQKWKSCIVGLDAATGKLAPLNSRGTGGSATHLATDATGRMLVTVNYGGGFTASFPLAADGRIGPRASLLAHAGPLGPNTKRQEKPHPHSVTFSPDNRFAFVADLGLDRVLAYKIDPATGTLTPHDPAFIPTPPGTGPRHTKFSRDGRFFYILNEIDGSISACAYDAARGAGTPIQHISTLPAGFVVTDPDRAAEIRLHPNGRFVYASNRGHESIAVFAIQADGTLKLVEITSCGGKHPRNFELSPDGNWLVCANQNSNNLVSFKVDATTGRLTATGSTVTVPQAVCVLFAAGG